MPKFETPSMYPENNHVTPVEQLPMEEDFTSGAPKKQINPLLAGTIGAMIGVVATSLVFAGVIWGFNSPNNAAQEQLEAAVNGCGDPAGFSLSDEGRSLVFDTKGEEDYIGGSVSDLACILYALETPAHVIDQMDRTTALAGNQSATWDNFEIQWSYHPDRGMDGSIAVVKAS